MSFKKMRHFQQRLIVSFISIIILFTLIYFSYFPPLIPVFASIIALSIGIAQWEYYRIAQAKQYSPMIKLGITTGVIYSLSVLIATQDPIFSFLPPMTLGLTFLFGFLYFFNNDSKPLANLAITLFGVAYIAIPVSTAISINYFFPEGSLQDGRLWLVYALTTTKVTDAGAYFSGKLLGSRPLATHISPKKTIEGSIGGLASAIVISCLFSLFSPLQIGFWDSIILGTVIGVLAQIGDLGESLLKRDAGVKDSNELPGLGGMLDVLDSLIFTLPIVYFYLHLQNI